MFFQPFLVALLNRFDKGPCMSVTLITVLTVETTKNNISIEPTWNRGFKSDMYVSTLR